MIHVFDTPSNKHDHTLNIVVMRNSLHCGIHNMHDHTHNKMHNIQHSTREDIHNMHNPMHDPMHNMHHHSHHNLHNMHDGHDKMRYMSISMIEFTRNMNNSKHGYTIIIRTAHHKMTIIGIMRITLCMYACEYA